MTEGVLGRQSLSHSYSAPYAHAVYYRRRFISWRRSAYVLRARVLDNARALSQSITKPVGQLREAAYPLSQALWRALYCFCAIVSCMALSARRSGHVLSRVGQFVLHLLKSLPLRRLHTRHSVVLVASAIALVLIGTFFYSLGLEVILNGESLGFVTSQQEFESAVAHVNERASEILGRPYLLTPNVSYQYSLVDRHALFSQRDVENQLFSQIDDIAYLYVLTIDGKAVGAVDESDTIQTVLDSVMEPALEDTQSYDVRFVGDVEISREWADRSLSLSATDLYAKLTTPVCDTETYELQVEDNLALVAMANGMSSDELLHLNPQVEVALAAPGDSLVVAPAIPLLSVEAYKNEEFSREVPFESVTVNDDDLYEGDTEIRVTGQVGQERVVEQVRYVNGNEDSRSTLSVQTLAEPVDEVTAVGTKKRPAKAPTGTYIYPCDGALSSNYGYRRLFNSFHAGIDLAASTGTPIVASDGGTVTYSGWQSGYGYCVMISHGNGVVSLYGHCSKLFVSVGQAVAQGERIANVGNTGRSTGPHCHFEVRVDGSAVSPWKFLN